jgi:uncharacterized protein YcbK (DUF882 family)
MARLGIGRALELERRGEETMTPLVAMLLAALIQPSDPLQLDAGLNPRSSVVIGSAQPGARLPGVQASKSALAAHPMILFTFVNRHEFMPIGANDVLTPDAIHSFAHFVRCVRTDQEKRVDPRLIEIALAAAQHFDVDTVEIISGYRARPYGAPHSKHFLGEALDLRLAGVNSSRLATWLWSAFHNVGVGYYPRQNFVHVDTRAVDLRWVDQSLRGESGDAQYFGRVGRVVPASARISMSRQPISTLAAIARPTT